MKRRLVLLAVRFLLRRAAIARIDFPRQKRSYLVLDEATAWAPSHVGGSAMPEQAGNCVVQFTALGAIELGDEIVLQTSGKSTKYRVRGQIANDRVVQIHSRMLTLVTPRFSIVATPA
jgi:hypothetical protein